MIKGNQRVERIWESQMSGTLNGSIDFGKGNKNRLRLI